MLDIDLFKRINDTHGHAAGDQVIAEIARRITAGVRTIDVARPIWRGRSSSSSCLKPPWPALGCWAIGCARPSPPPPSPPSQAGCPSPPAWASPPLTPTCPMSATLIARADSALYAAKQAGRNRIAAYGLPADPQTACNPVADKIA
jgi:hypothetical protein